MDVVHVAYMGGISIQSDFARKYAQQVAAAASLGYISTMNADGSYGRIWRPTTYGFDLVYATGAAL